VEGAGRFFSRRAKRFRRKFDRKGLSREQALLVDGLTESSVAGNSILEIGCGIGTVHQTLLGKGASAATGIDAAEGMIEQAKVLARDLKNADRTTYLQGDFMEAAGAIPPADITILDKVFCCYGNVNALVDASLGKTLRAYAVSFPRATLPVTLVFRSMAALGTFLGWSFHPWWHDWQAIVATIRRAGFGREYHRTTFVWDVYVFRR
jgi:magnesium-protoporphyrin O-methyltransferase